MTEGNTNMYMPVVPAGSGYGGNDGFMGGNGGGWWFILLILAMCGFGGGWGGWGGNMGGGMFPWMLAGQNNTDNDVQRGFDQSAVITGITGVHNAVTDGFGNVQTALCNGFGNVQNSLCSGFAGMNAGIANGFAQAEIAANTRQIANMQQGFNGQTAMMNGFNGIQGQIAQYGYDNRSGLADLKYTVATENCADRTAAAQNTRDIIESSDSGFQKIMDKLCALELDGVKSQLAAAQRENIGLQNQLNMAAMRESQTAQNALIAQGLNNEVDALYNRLNNCPVPSVPVYGRTPIYTCGGTVGCGCAA